MHENCPDPETLSAYMDEALPPDRMLELDDHIFACTACRERTCRAQLLHIAMNEDDTPPPDLLPDIMAKVECQQRTQERVALGWSRWGPIPLAAAAGVMLTIGVLLGESMFQHSVPRVDPLAERMRVFDVIPPGGMFLHNGACCDGEVE